MTKHKVFDNLIRVFDDLGYCLCSFLTLWIFTLVIRIETEDKSFFSPFKEEEENEKTQKTTWKII